MIDTRHIFVDADACPVKEEVYKVAFRHEVRVSIVSNMMMRVPVHPLVTRIVVGSGFDAADDWIAERASSTAVVITADILLADRCLKAGASVIAPNGKPFTPNSIGSAIRSEEHTSELKSLMRSSYAVSCLKKKTKAHHHTSNT